MEQVIGKVIMTRFPSLIAAFSLAGVAVSVSSYAAQAMIVTCTATRGFHCTPEQGCSEDATYITTYKIDLGQMTVEELTVQHVTRDPGPRPGSTKYAIARSSPSTPPPLPRERSIIAVGTAGSAAVETILIGEKSYLSSSVSSAGTRIFSMMGTCKGF
jgi:hypothetical protein